MILVVVTAYIAKVPAAALVALGLLGTPAYAVPAALGTIAYYTIHQVKKSAAAIQAAKSSSFVNDMIKFAKQAVSSKEMWLMVIAGIICIILVYTIRRAADGTCMESRKRGWGIGVSDRGSSRRLCTGCKDFYNNIVVGAVVAW